MLSTIRWASSAFLPDTALALHLMKLLGIVELFHARHVFTIGEYNELVFIAEALVFGLNIGAVSSEAVGNKEGPPLKKVGTALSFLCFPVDIKFDFELVTQLAKAVPSISKSSATLLWIRKLELTD